MGIFEKSIPKYIHNHENEVVIAPEQDLSTLPPEPYIDDIFDPLFNRSVRSYLHQKYGYGPNATLSGYSELIDNVWNGNEGIFGKGMGVLSAFGRSMEKADDLIIGGLTEGVKGLTGQGFENPIENIFVEDQDYTGRRLLAAMANSMSDLAGGTTVDESDFGSAYDLPALGIELMTDVGIAGGALANKFAPAVHAARQTGKMTSKEILQNLGKNGASQILGEVGQLLSDYDDLMAKVAIDITAPGLRPAFKALRNKLAQYLQTNSPYNIANVIKHRQNPDSPPPEDAGAAVAVAQLIDDVTETMDSIPVAETELADAASKSAEQLTQEVLDDEPYTYYKFIKDAIESEGYAKIASDLRDYTSKYAEGIDLKYGAHVSEQGEAVGEMIRRMQASGVPIDKIGVDQLDEFTIDENNLARARNAIRKVLPNVNPEYAEDLKYFLYRSDVPEEEKFLRERLQEAIATRTFTTNTATNEAILSELGEPFFKDAVRYVSANPKYTVSPSIFSKIDSFGELGTTIAQTRLELARHSFRDLNRPRFSNLEELTAYLDSPRMKYAIEEYFPNTKPKERAIDYSHPVLEAILDDPSSADKLAQGLIPHRIRRKPSVQLFTLEEMADRVGYDETAPWHRLHSSFLEPAVEDYEIIWKPARKDPITPLSEVKQAILDVYYPKEDSSIREYTASLGKLSSLLDDSKMTAISEDILKAAPDESMFLEDLFRAFDDYEEIPGSGTKYYGIDQTYLQRVRDEMPSAKGSRRTSQSVTHGLKDVSSTGKGAVKQPYVISSNDTVSRMRDDTSTAYASYVKSALAQAAPYIKTDEDLLYFIEPVLKYYQIQPTRTLTKVDNIRKSLSHTLGISEDYVPEHLIADRLLSDRLVPSERTVKIVKNFEDNVFPKLKSYVDKGGNPLSYRKFGNATWDEHHEVRSLLGYVDTSSHTGVERATTLLIPEDGYANRLMFKELWDPKTNTLRAPEWRNFYDFVETDSFKPTSNLSTDAIILEDAVMRARLSQGLFDEPKLTFNNSYTSIFDEHRKQFTTPKTVSETVEAVQEAIVNETSEQVAKQAYETITPATATVENVSSELAPRVDSFIRNGGSEEAAKHIFGEEEWNLWKKVQEAAAVPTRNASGDKATLRAKGNVELAKRFEALQGRVPEPYKKFKRYYILQSERLGDTLAGSNFWKEFRSSSMFTSGYPKGHFMIKKTQDALTRNANIVNRILGGDYAEVIVHNVHNKQGTVAVTMRWNTKHSNVVDAIRKHRSELERANFEDIVFAQPRALTQSELDFLNSDEMRELDELMRELQFRAADQARTLGFVYDTSIPYTRHAMSHSPDTAQYLNSNFYVGAASSDLDDISAHISDLYGDKGVFGSREVARRFRGSYWNLENPDLPIFEYMPDRVFKSTLSDGMFANNQYQSFVDLFHNDSFKISEWFKSVDDLKEVLCAKHPDGSLSGNLQNLELVTFRTDAEGRLIGLTKFDKMSDAGLEAALKNPDTILVPAGAVTHMDKLLRKDVRMGNKFWAFVNKHLTIPFKFGLLSNPGFLLGNVGDATLKLTTTMSEKYGTTMAEEAQRTAESIATVMNTRSMYYDAFQKFLEDCEINDVPLGPEEMIPDIVAMSPKRKERFLKYLNGELTVKVKGSKEPLTVVPTLTKQQEEACRFWFMLQEMQMSSNKLREYEDLAELSHKSRFDIPGNAFDRITQGSGQYDPKNFRTWGIFMNNPVMNAFTDASESWEELIRTASIVDDLRHRGYGAETFGKQLSPDELLEFDVAKVDAKNAMYNAQFDYERTNDFIDSVGKVVPFPIFFLKNFQYWMDLWMKNPQWVDNAIDVQEGLWAGRREEDEDNTFAIEAKGRGAIPVGGESLPDWFKGIYKPAPLQSMFSAFSLLNSPVSDISYRLHPLIGGTAAAVNEQYPNDLTTSLFPAEDVKYRPYSTDIYERNVKVGDPNFNPMEYTLHRMNPFERVTNTYLRTPAKIEKGEQQLSDFLPSVFQPDF